MIRLVLILFCLLSSNSWATPQGRVRISVEDLETIWVGQRVLVHLDLMSDAFSFSNQRFELPQISGAVLLKTDSSTLKLSETIDTEAWQILRYDLSFFAQRAGALEIPPFEVQFNASAGYGQPESSFDMKTKALQLDVSMPPGADPSQPVITSSRVTIEERWQPDQSEFMVGDALTRIIRIEAEDVASIALPVAPSAAIEGIDQIPQTPEVRDTSNRGSLSGRRSEQIAYFFKREGHYTLPGDTISWWNPVTKTLESYELEARMVDISANPLAQNATEPSVKTAQPARLLKFLFAAMLLITLGGLFYWRRPVWQARRKARLDAEPARFKRAIKACDSNNPLLAWSTTNEWLDCVSIKIPSAQSKAWQTLQRALVLQSPNWVGNEMKGALKEIRGQIQTQSNQPVYLRPLNP